MNKNEYVKRLIEDNEITKNIYEAIYMINDIMISGEFDYGCRGVDHNTLLYNDMTWDDVLNWGIVIVPETQTYISDASVMDLDEIGYERLPLNKNHIKGY